MFTGIVEGVGRIVAVEPHGDGCRLRVDAADVRVDDVALGDSIAVNGCCLTVVARDGTLLAFDVSAAIPPTSWYGTLLKAIFNFSRATTTLHLVVWLCYVIPVMAIFALRTRSAHRPRPAAVA